MNKPLLFVRYLLIVIPGVATIYVSQAPISYPQYVLLLLLFLWVVQQRDHNWWEMRLAHSAFPAAFMIEILFLAWLSHSYGGVLVVAFCSSLISLIDRQRYFIPLALGAGMAMNIVVWQQDSILIIITNITYISIALLLYRIHEASGDKQEIEELYDALKIQHYDLEEARKTVLEYAKKVQHIAQSEERNRIAHDLHDDLGHKLIRLKMMLDAAIQLSGRQPEKTEELIREVRDQLAGSMESLRSTVRQLKPGHDVAKQYSLAGFIEQFTIDSGIQIHYQMHGAPYPLYPSEEFILYRNAQEAITNAIRHGQASEVNIRLNYLPKELRMSVSNNGVIPAQTNLIKGLGVTGMEERLRVVGGRLEFKTEEQFTVITILPHRQTTALSIGGMKE